jgi:hypothetical protein
LTINSHIYKKSRWRGIDEHKDLQVERQDQDGINLQELEQVHLDDEDDEDW